MNKALVYALADGVGGGLCFPLELKISSIWLPPGKLGPPPTGNPGSAPGMDASFETIFTTHQKCVPQS